MSTEKTETVIGVSPDATTVTPTEPTAQETASVVADAPAAEVAEAPTVTDAASAPHKEPLLEVNNLSVTFKTDDGDVKAVKNVSFSIAKGETLAIVGESGSGKSVSSLTVMGLLPMPPAVIESGDITFHRRSGEAVSMTAASTDTLRSIRGNEIAMIFQEPMTSLNPVYPIGDQIAEAVMLHQGKDKQAAWAHALEMLKLVEIPNAEKRINDYPHQLSGGMRQRVMIAMALSCNPALLIADEPTTALDVMVQAQILDLMRKLQREIGTSILFITHDLGVVAEMADRVVVMEKGVVVEEGDVHTIFNKPEHPYTQRLLNAVPRINLEDLAPDDVNRPNLIEVRNLQVYFPIKGGLLGRTQGHVKAVDGISFDIKKGELLGLVGESGSGKTTAGRAILRLIEPTGGQVLYEGQDLRKLNKEQLRQYRKKMQIIFQDPFASLNPRFTVEEILAEPLDIHKVCPPGPQRRERVAELLEMVQLPREAMTRYPHEFSGGQRQRMGIARSLALNPEFIVADESVSALDVSIRKEVLELLRDLKERLNLTMLFISHDLSVVESISDRVAVMYRGHLVELKTAHELYRNPEDDYTRALLSAIPIPEPGLQRQRLPWDPDAYAQKRAAIVAAAKGA